jgi:molybdopterin synthase sulfur carrier subunit
MAVRVSIPTALRQYAGGNSAINVEGSTVGEVIQTLTTQHPELGKQLMQNGEVRNFVNVYLNDDDVRYLEGMATAIGPRDEISIIPAIAGGR